MRSTVAAAVVLLWLAAAALPVEPARAQARGRAARARKVDEFGRLYGCDAGARLDSFAVELQGQPGAKGYVVSFESARQAPGTGRIWSRTIRDYLVEMRGVPAERIERVDAGTHDGDRMKIELWLVPPGADVPAFAPAGGAKAAAFAGKFEEYGAFDDTQFYDFEGGGVGAYNLHMAHVAFAGQLRRQEEAQGYLVVYSKPGSAPGFWRRVGTRERRKIASGELDESRLTIINGGVNRAKWRNPETGEDEPSEDGRVELWIAAKGQPPVKHSEDEGKLGEALKVGVTNFDPDDHSGVTGWAFNNLAEAMLADARSLGCIVVNPPGPPEGQGAGDEAGEQKPSPDAFEEVERLKAELVRKHGFEGHRLVVVTGPSSGWRLAQAELWLVPYGASLPDPFASENAEPAEDAGDDPRRL